MMQQTNRVIPLLLLLASACAPTPEERRPVESARQQAKTVPTPAAPVMPERAAPATMGQPFKIALLVPLSGEGKALGKAMQDAALLALSEQRQASVVLLPKNTGSESSEAANAARQVMKDQPSVVLGPLFSRSLEAALPVFRQSNVPVLSFSNNTMYARQGAFLLGFMPDQQVERVVTHAVQSGARSFAALVPNDAYGQAVADALRAAAAVHGRDGAKVAQIEFYPPGAKDMVIEITRLLGQQGIATGGPKTKPAFDALLIPEGGERLKAIAASLASSPIDLSGVRLLGSGQWDDSATPTGLPMLHGAWYPGAEPAARAGFEQRFRRMFNYTPPRLASIAYDAVTILSQRAASDTSRLTEAEFSSAAYTGPVDGVIRCNTDGLCRRDLVIMELTAHGSNVVSTATH